MKRLIVVTLLISLIMSFASCSPVSFNGAITTNCTPSNPCINANGTYTVNQSFTFNQTNNVDILIVDDNSGSMTQEQQNLASSFSGLTSTLDSKGVNWQMAVTTTDVCTNTTTGLCQNPSIPGSYFVPGAVGQFIGPLGSNPMYGSYIMHSTDANVAQTFSQTIQRQNQLGSGDERAIYAANLALFSGIPDNAGFLRSNSNLAVIILSDEDERSVGGNCFTDPSNPLFEFPLSNNPAAPNYSPQYPCDPSYAPLEALDYYQNFLNTFTATYNGTKNLVVNSIVVKPMDRACLTTQVQQAPVYTGHYGNNYEAFAKATATPNSNNPGQSPDNTYSICNNGNGQFAQDMNSISGTIANSTDSTHLILNYTPISINSVTYASNPGMPVSYTYTPGTNYISLNSIPPNGTVVLISYNHS